MASGQTFGAEPLLAHAHHGSVSKEQRAAVEDDLKSGRLRAVVFDCDGVLVDSEPTHARATSEHLASLGTPIDPAANYQVTTNDFLANGGDGFTALTAGTNRVYAPGFDIDALVAYLGTGPIPPGPANRITRTG